MIKICQFYKAYASIQLKIWAFAGINGGDGQILKILIVSADMMDLIVGRRGEIAQLVSHHPLKLGTHVRIPVGA